MKELRDYQVAAIDKLRSGSVLCGGVGSGKSFTALSFWQKKIESDAVYVITTPKKRDSHDWETEMENIDRKASIFVVDSWNNIKKYDQVKDAFFIFDEQRIVGNGAWVHAFLRIAAKNQWILLTATPGDTWMDYIPIFLANRFYRNRTEFIRRHVVYGRNVKYPVVERYLEEGRLERFRNKVLVEMFYRPPAKQISHRLGVGYNQELYKSVLRDRWNPYTNSPIRDISECCRVLRRIVGEYPDRMEQLNRLVVGRRTIIFYNYDYELELLRGLGEHISVAEWNGHKHNAIPSSDSWVYLVNYLAGAEAWECTTTDQMIFYSLSYSYKIMVQAAGRINRCNTPYSELHYYYFHSGSTIENAIERALKNKKNFNELHFNRK